MARKPFILILASKCSYNYTKNKTNCQLIKDEEKCPEINLDYYNLFVNMFLSY